MGCGASKIPPDSAAPIEKNDMPPVKSAAGGASAGSGVPCVRKGCPFFKHTKQVHGFCCKACQKAEGQHGPLCEKVAVPGAGAQQQTVAAPPPSSPSPAPGSSVTVDWEPSLAFGAHATGTDDPMITGTETMHLEPHRGQLFASFGNWMSPNFVKKNFQNMNPCIARLERAGGKWVMDMHAQHSSRFATRISCLKSITWTRGSRGQALAPPVQQLVAIYGLAKHGSFMLFRDDNTPVPTSARGRCQRQGCPYYEHTAQGHGFCCGACVGTKGAHGPKCEKTTKVATSSSETQQVWREVQYSKPKSFRGESTARVVLMHRDSVTGVDRIFALEGYHGAISGVYDPASNTPGHVVWDQMPEKLDLPKGLSSLELRPLAMQSVGGSLYMSSGSFILKRADGPDPVWRVVFDVAQHLPLDGKLKDAVGGLRGMSAVLHPSGKGSSLMFCWTPNGKSRAEILRLDLEKDGSVKSAEEESSIQALAKQYLGQPDIHYTLAAYNDIRTIHVDGCLLNLIGFEVVPSRGAENSDVPMNPGQPQFWAGGGVVVRLGPGQYEVVEIGGRRHSPKDVEPCFTGVRTYTQSPFSEEPNTVYFGGYDCNNSPSEHTAYVYKGKFALSG